MNVSLLIDAIVRQTMVLIAQLATSGGLRAPLAHVAGQTFLNLARELESHGVAKKVSADMFGMALRTYQRRTQRLSQSRTDRGRSLWEAVLEFIERGDVVTRDAVFERFRYDDEASLRGVLRDLTESSLVFASGSGQSRAYRLSTLDERRAVHKGDDRTALEALVWSVVYREEHATFEHLAASTGLARAELEPVLDSLIAGGRVEKSVDAGQERFRSRNLSLGLNDASGWEASVLDHFSTLVQTITRKLSLDQKAREKDEVGGSTYHLDLWRGHPMEDEVIGELARFRTRMSALRQKLDQYNAEHPKQPELVRVHAYYGQWFTEEERDETTDGDEA
jgi:hypothetical protein